MISRLKSFLGPRNPLRLAYHAAKAFVAALFFGFPARKITVIGVTGTDGKTTTAAMIAHILRANGKKTGMASTAFFDDGTGVRENSTHLTSISPFTLQKLLRTMVQRGCTHAVLEYSSHGLVQHRLDWTYPKVAAITNISPEHLDYHGTMEQYRRDKGILFQMLQGKGTKVLNAEDGTFEMYRNITSEKTTVWSSRSEPQGENATTLWIVDIKTNATFTQATLHVEGPNSQPATLRQSSGQACILQLSVPGLFNLENALAAIGASVAIGIQPEQAASALRSFTGVPGRLERITAGQPFSVFVDFAVTPAAYEKALLALRGTVDASHRVLVLCSSCGNRMKEKRPLVGKVCSLHADVVVATEDETYGEDPIAVLDEVWNGIDQSACTAYKIPDRKTAIRKLFGEAKDGDAVVLCGMGPFSTMTKLEGRIPWDEREVAREVLKEMGYGKETRYKIQDTRG